VANNNYPQITSVTSEALQAQIRSLLPSQEGFGTDLMAQNVIVPVIDLTAAAEGTTTGQNLQTAIAFGSMTAFSAAGSTAVIANTAGFYKIIGFVSQFNSSGGGVEASFTMSDGLSTKTIWSSETVAAIDAYTFANVEFIVFLASGESISAVSNSGSTFIKGSSRQIADVNGNLVNPSGFTPQ
jgi:hypothetical protein